MDSPAPGIGLLILMISCCSAQESDTSPATGLSSGVHETIRPTGVPVSSSVHSITTTSTTAAKTDTVASITTVTKTYTIGSSTTAGSATLQTPREKPSDSSSTTPVIVAVVILLLLLAAGAIVAVFVYRRRFPTNGNIVPTSPILPNPELVLRSSILLTNFPRHFRKMSADSNLKFFVEYKEFALIGTDQPCDAAECHSNRPKNRFINISPYDHSRVKLFATDDVQGSDYINANWMPGYSSKREYISCQGPLTTTVDDMWRMVWEYNCQAIVMLTKCTEGHRDKCEHYWPHDAEPVFYGDLRAVNLNRTETSETCVTEIELSLGMQRRRLPHFHFLAWPDFQVPDKPQSLVHFARMVRGRLKSHAGPVVVHCSAGVGRSGTFIAVDRILQHIQDNDSVDIFDIVREMRTCRPMMVQTELQYIYIHKCLRFVLKGDENEIDNEGFEDDKDSDTDSGTASD